MTARIIQRIRSPGQQYFSRYTATFEQPLDAAEGLVEPGVGALGLVWPEAVVAAAAAAVAVIGAAVAPHVFLAALFLPLLR